MSLRHLSLTLYTLFTIANVSFYFNSPLNHPSSSRKFKHCLPTCNHYKTISWSACTFQNQKTHKKQKLSPNPTKDEKEECWLRAVEWCHYKQLKSLSFLQNSNHNDLSKGWMTDESWTLYLLSPFIHHSTMYLDWCQFVALHNKQAKVTCAHWENVQCV